MKISNVSGHKLISYKLRVTRSRGMSWISVNIDASNILFAKFSFCISLYCPDRHVTLYPVGGVSFLPKKVPISKDFSQKYRPIFLNFRVLAWRTPNILQILDGKHPCLWVFLLKSGPMSKDFLWKNNTFGQHIPV